jgi:uncharacterized protein YkwD
MLAVAAVATCHSVRAEAGEPARLAAAPLGRELARRAAASGEAPLEVDESLSRAARAHAAEIAADPGRARLDRIRNALAREGLADSQVLPFAGLGGGLEALRSAAEAQIDERVRGRGFTHLGIGVAEKTSGELALVVLYVRRLVELAPLPRLAKPPSFKVRGTTLRPARAWSAVLTTPRGEAAPLPVERSGRHVSLSVPFGEGPGRYTVELLAHTELGPEVAALWSFSLGEAEPDAVWESATSTRAAPEAGARLEALIQAVRVQYGRARPTRDTALDQAARGHAADVCRAMRAAHILPGGTTPDQRAARAGHAGPVAENIAIAASVEIAHQNLLDSPSHRLNLLERRVQSFGLGLVESRGTWCVVELFGLSSGDDSDQK